jgi:hypothetical protein
MNANEPMTDKCIACGGPVNFTVQLILSSRYSSPRRQQSSKVIGVCDSCCSPRAVGYGELKTSLAMQLWQNRNIHTQKLETVPADAMTQASGE